MRTKITVTQEDIDDGVRSNCDLCPIAIAVSSALKVHVKAYPSFIAGPFRFKELSRRAKKFIDDFDSGKPVKPFSFYLEVPE